MSAAPTLPVVFRKWRGDVIALFPTEEWAPGEITSYMRVGQHGGACRSLTRAGRRATPDEYGSLLAELRSIYESEPAPITLKVYRRSPSYRRGAA